MPLTLDHWLDRLEKRRPEHKMLLGLDRIAKILPRIVPEHKKIARRIITVGGTNGKGSTVAFLENIFRSAGLDCGATSSPHIFKFNERIRLQGKPVSDQTICDAFERIEKAREEIFLSYFEFAALAAFDIFYRNDLDVVVLEVGLGGRLDAMNAIDSDIAVVTTVDLDHQNWLGDTIEEIALEKAGIYRIGKPAIYGSQPVPFNLAQTVESLGAKAFFRNSHFQVRNSSTHWSFSGKDDTGHTVTLTDLPYSHLPFTSAVCAVQAALLLDTPIGEKGIRDGLRTASLFGRNHLVTIVTPKNHKVKIRFDVAHNPQAGRYLAERLSASPASGKRIALVAMLQDKNYQETLTAFSGCFDYWNTSTVAFEERALDGQYLNRELEKMRENTCCHDSIEKAVAVLSNHLVTGDELVVFGSFHTVSEAFEALSALKIPVSAG